MSSHRTPLRRGDHDPPDDEHVRGVDWDYCAWCGDDGWMPGSRWARPAGVMALATTEHYVTCPHTDADTYLPACPDCIESGVADTHPDEADILADDLTNS